MGVGGITNPELTQEADHAAEASTRAQLLATPTVRAKVLLTVQTQDTKEQLEATP